MSLPRELRQQILVQSMDDPLTKLNIKEFRGWDDFPDDWFEGFLEFQKDAKDQAKVLESIAKEVNQDMVGDVDYALGQWKAGYEEALWVFDGDYEHLFSSFEEECWELEDIDWM